MSTPAIRATLVFFSSALTLLVPRVVADDDYAAVTPDDLALLADPLDARSDLHASFLVPLVTPAGVLTCTGR
jgi:hypothetical protein